MLNRRDFLKVSGASTAAGLFTACGSRTAVPADAQGLERVGLGLFSIPTLLEQDFAGTMEMLAGIGYKEIETFGPYPFSAPEAQERWNTITPALGFQGSGYFGLTAQQVKEVLDRNGLSSPSMHIDLETLRTRMGETAEAAHVLGQRYVIIPSAGAQPDLDGYRRLADEFNQIGASAVANGIRFAYHNHGYGLAEVEGEIPLNVILEQTDPELVDFQMDVYWTVAGGADPVAYLDAYPGRYRLMHVKDMTEHVRFSGDGGDPQQWMELFPYMTDAGSGVLDLPAILSQARASGVEHFLVERDLAPNPSEALQRSYDYLAGVELEG